MELTTDLKRKLIRGGAVLVVALAAGHLVQTMNESKTAQAEKPKAVEQVSAGPEKAAAKADPAVPAAASLAAAVPAVPKAEEKPVEVAALTDSTAALPVPKVEPPAVSPEAAVLPKVEPAPVASAPAVAPEAPVVADEKSCTVDMKLTAGPQAMIQLSLTAPCRAGERVVLRHAGLAVAESLSQTGTLVLDLPALTQMAEVSALFSDAEIATGSVQIPDAAKLRRFGVQWMADDAFQLHAMEKGAGYGAPGHVFADAPVSPNGGYLVTLGNPTLALPMLAQVYTWPADVTIPSDVVVEAAVTDLTCGRELLGETVASVAGTVTITDLTLATPECDAVGDILVLKNLAPDLTLASN